MNIGIRGVGAKIEAKKDLTTINGDVKMPKSLTATDINFDRLKSDDGIVQIDSGMIRKAL